MEINDSISHKDIWIKYFLTCLIGVVLAWVTHELLFNDELYFNALSAKLSDDVIQNIINQTNKWGWVGYVSLPFIYLLKFTLVTTCLSLGYFFAFNRFVFKKFFATVVFAEAIFLVSLLIRLLWFLVVQTHYDLNSLSVFTPLSAMNFADAEHTPLYWVYPLRTLNIFELIYWLLLAYGLSDSTGQPFGRSLGIVFFSYGMGLLLWIILVMFVTITYT